MDSLSFYEDASGYVFVQHPDAHFNYGEIAVDIASVGIDTWLTFAKMPENMAYRSKETMYHEVFRRMYQDIKATPYSEGVHYLLHLAIEELELPVSTNSMDTEDGIDLNNQLHIMIERAMGKNLPRAYELKKKAIFEYNPNELLTLLHYCMYINMDIILNITLSVLEKSADTELFFSSKHSRIQHFTMQLRFIDGSIKPVFSTDSVLSLAIFDLSNIINQNIEVKACGNCGKFFIPANRSDTKYCPGQAPQDPSKSCQEYGAYMAWTDRAKNDDCYRLYRRLYMKKQMLAKRNPDIEDYRADFEAYKAATVQWKADVKAGIRTSEEYLTWLEKEAK